MNKTLLAATAAIALTAFGAQAEMKHTDTGTVTAVKADAITIKDTFGTETYSKAEGYTFPGTVAVGDKVEVEYNKENNAKIATKVTEKEKITAKINREKNELEAKAKAKTNNDMSPAAGTDADAKATTDTKTKY